MFINSNDTKGFLDVSKSGLMSNVFTLELTRYNRIYRTGEDKEKYNYLYLYLYFHFEKSLFSVINMMS